MSEEALGVYFICLWGLRKSKKDLNQITRFCQSERRAAYERVLSTTM
jgi:hypothetical protein